MAETTQIMIQRCTILREIREYFELEKKRSTAYPTVQNIAKSVLRGKYISLNDYSRK